MLRASARRTGVEVDLRGVTHDDVDPRLPHGRELLAFADALLAGAGIDAARDRLVAASGPEAAERAAGVAGTFQMMNRVLDATGCPTGAHGDRVAELLGVTRPGSPTDPHPR